MQILSAFLDLTLGRMVTGQRARPSLPISRELSPQSDRESFRDRESFGQRDVNSPTRLAGAFQGI